MFPFTKYETAIRHLCEKHNVRRLFVFGSALSDKFDLEKSDFDVLVEMLPMPPIQRGQRLLQFWKELEALLGRKVDLLTKQSLRNPYLRKEIENTKRLFYDHESQKVPV